MACICRKLLVLLPFDSGLQSESHNSGLSLTSCSLMMQFNIILYLHLGLQCGLLSCPVHLIMLDFFHLNFICFV
jgi:hypothetical protein